MILESGKAKLDLNYPQVMGILNITPDSFSDGGKHNDFEYALVHTAKMIQAGATIIDVGGESTRPGASLVTIDEELNRIIPIIEAISARLDCWISVDTSKAAVITEASNAGAHLINDIRSLHESGALEAAAASGLPICLMHMQGDPANMQEAPYYEDVVQDVANFFSKNIARCEAAGINKNRLLLDPGFGFGKNLAHNYQLLSQLSTFQSFGLPLLVGMSRKSMVGQLLGVGPNERLAGSLACAVIAVMNGAQIIRVHDVKETVDAIRVVEATLSAKG